MLALSFPFLFATRSGLARRVVPVPPTGHYSHAVSRHVDSVRRGRRTYSASGLKITEGQRNSLRVRRTAIICVFADRPRDPVIWQTNLHRLAARTMYTAFFAGETFLPRCSIDGQNIQRFLEGHFNEAFGRLADAIAREDGGSLLDTCVIGWDSLNEPGLGFIEIPDLNVLPPSQDFK